MISITLEASEYLKEFLNKNDQEDQKLICKSDVKLTVEKTGCSGNKYSIRPISIKEICNGEFLCFDSNKIVVWYERGDQYLINGCQISLEEDMISKRILVTNPLIKMEMCGCGESFYTL